MLRSAVAKQLSLTFSLRLLSSPIFLIALSTGVLGLASLLLLLSLTRPFLGVGIGRQGEMWVVQDIHHFGVAYEAGVRAGDRIAAVEGQAPEEIQNLRSLSMRGFIREIEMTSHGGESRLISVEGKISAPRTLQVGSLFVLGLTYWGIGTLVYARRKPEQVALLLFLFSLTFFLALTSTFSALLGIRGIAELHFLSGSLVAPLFLHLFLLFPQEKGLLRKRAFPYALYLPAFLLIGAYAVLRNNEQLYYGWVRPLLMLHLALGLSLGLASLLHSFAGVEPGRSRQQVKIVLLGVVVSVMPFLALSLLPEILAGRSLVPPELSILGAIALPLSLGYTIARYRLLDVDFYLSRALVYGSITVLLLGGYLFGLFIISMLIPFEQSRLHYPTIALFSLVVALSFFPIRERIQRIVDRMVYRDRYDYRKTLELLSAEFFARHEVEGLTGFMVTALSRTLGLQGACLLLFQEGKWQVVAVAGEFQKDEEKRQEARDWARRLPPGQDAPWKVPQQSPVSLLVPLEMREKGKGLLCLGEKVSRAEFRRHDLSLLATLSRQAGTALENVLLLDEARRHQEELEKAYHNAEEQASSLRGAQEELQKAYLDIARTLVLALEARDHYTRGHSERMSFYARRIAQELNLSPGEVQAIEQAALFHDVGKIAIPDSILLKPGTLDPDEWSQMQLHPGRSVEILRFLGFLEKTLPAIQSHHERYDGKGYPSGWRGEEIPLGGRILAVADAYDAMTSERPYRSALSHIQVVQTLTQGAGTAWDPPVVQALLQILAAEPPDTSR